jgi:hypothetical protein
MSKNLTRKGLALGAVVALGSTLIAGSPAFAADLSIAPASTSTANSVLLSDTFTLKTAAAGNTNSANLAALKYEVVNTSGVTVAVSGFQNTTAVTESTSDTGTTKVYTPSAVTTTIGEVNKLVLDPTTTSTTATFSVTVRSFADLDSSGSVTTGDLVSDVQVVNFVKGSEVTPTISLDAPQAGVAPTASITLDKGINLEQTTASNYKFVFIQNGTAATADNATLDTDKAKLNGTHAGFTVAAGDVIGAKVQIVRYDGDTDFATSAVVAQTVLAASDATKAALTLSNSANVRASVSGDTGYGTTTGTTYKVVRSGTKAVDFSVAFTKAPDTTKVAAGKPVTITLRSVAIDADAKITVGSKSVKSGDSTDKVIYTTTDANGKVAVSVASLNGKAGDHVTVTVVSNGQSVTADLLWASAAASSLVETSALAGASAVRNVVKGGTVSLSYSVFDQWKQPYVNADNNYRLAVTSAGTASFAQYVAVTAGKATVTVADNSTATTSYSVGVALQSQTGTAAWANVGSVATTTALTLVDALPVAATVTLNDATLDNSAAIATTGVPLSTENLVAEDRRFDDNTNAALTYVAGEGALVSGIVKAANGSTVAGQAVTIALAGAALVSEANVSALGSITVYTASNGTFSVKVYSITGGKQTVSVTAGAATATQAITFAAASATAGKTIALTLATSAQAGRAVDVSALLLDKSGNPVKAASAVTFAVTGVGYISATSAVSTDAKGVASTKLIVGAGETGDATVTATFTNADGDDVVATKTISFGVTDAQVEIVGKRVTATTSFSKGKTVSFYVDGIKKWSKLSVSDAEVTLYYNLKKGTHTVAVKISGGFVTTEKFIVK